MEPAGLKTTEPRNSTDHQSGLSLSVARGNSYQVWWAPDAFGLIWKKEETLALIRKENGAEDPAKSWISNRQLSGNSGTLLRRLSLSRSGALPVKSLELVLEKRRLCGDLSPASALAILQKTPPDAVGIHDQTQATATIYSPLAVTNFLERHYVKTLKNSAGHRWVDRK
jgi:hypothetical protein